MLFEHAHRFCDSAFELGIATSDDVLGPVLDIHIGRDAFILYRPFSIAREEATARFAVKCEIGTESIGGGKMQL